MQNIVATHALNRHFIAYDIEAPDVAEHAEPGHTVMVGFDGAAPAPCAIADYDRGKNTITVVAALPVEDSGADEPSPADEPVEPPTPAQTAEVTGPLGRPRLKYGVSKVLCIAQDLGVASMFTRLRQYKKSGAYTAVIAGYPTREHAFWIDRLKDFADELYVVTEDGSFGIKGPIRQTIRAVCEHADELDVAFAVGPLPFLKTCCNVTATFEIPTMVSLNAVMSDVGEPHAAIDPEVLARFDWENLTDQNGHDIDFDILMKQFGIQMAK